MNFIERVEFSEALKKVSESQKSLPTQLFFRCKDGVIHLFAEAGGVCIPGVGYVAVLEHTIQKSFLLEQCSRLGQTYLSLYKRPMKATALVKQMVNQLVNSSRQDVYGRFPDSAIVIVDNLFQKFHVVTVAASAQHHADTALIGFGRYSSILVNSFKALGPHSLTAQEVRKHLGSPEIFRGTDLRPGMLKARLLKSSAVDLIQQYASKGSKYTSSAYSLDDNGFDQMGPFIERLILLEELVLDEGT